MDQEPIVLDLEHVQAIHARSLIEHGGADGIRNAGGLKAAVTQARNVYYYLGGDLFELAAAYAFHIAEAQAYLDGNKRTAVATALIFLEANEIGTTDNDPMALYQPMIDVAKGSLDREGLAEVMRKLFA